jgi:anti-sigma factor RsiW/uncharacterized small protein (DUF1192 family)
MKAAEHTVAPEELMAYLDGELSEDRRVTVHAHMLQCDPCGRTISQLRQVSRDAALWQVEAAPATLTAPWGALAGSEPRRPWRFAWYRPAAIWQFVAVSGVLVVIALATVMPTRFARPSGTVVTLPVPSAGLGGADGSGGRGGSLTDTRPARVQDQGVAAGAADQSSGRFVAPRSMPAAVSAAESKTGGRAAEQGAVSGGRQGPLIVRNARLAITAKDFDAVRPAVERILRDVGGFIAQIHVADGQPSRRALRATLRVPAARLDAALVALRQLGHVADESQTGDDVTEQVRDVGARLVNARNTESRLNDVLQKRTGDVGDVLEVEREIARVRAEIERLDAERANLEGRVSHAAVVLEVDEERKATLDMGALPVSAQVRNALIDGCRGALDSALSLSLFALRAGPSVILWLAVLWWPARFVLRARRKTLT